LEAGRISKATGWAASPSSSTQLRDEAVRWGKSKKDEQGMDKDDRTN
jgi:hypothetical protein